LSANIIQLGAAEIARRIAAGDLSASEVAGAFIDRIQQIDPQLNSVIWPMFDQAQQAAAAADEVRRRGQSLGPLHGVPVTIKECYHVAGTPSSIGLTHRSGQRSKTDGVLVNRLRRAGAIVLGKTNLPQIMIWHESDNPVYGRTNNPWDLARSPGGSTGGEAAIIAAGGSPLGLGGDLGGSIRLPCHFCGIHGIKPTSHRLTRQGTAVNLRGMEVVPFQSGPMARHVEDLELALRVLTTPLPDDVDEVDVAPGPLRPTGDVKIDSLRIATWSDDGYFPAAPAIRRAVAEAADVLRARGAIVEPFQPPEVDVAIRLYYAILAADGGADAARLLHGSRRDWRVRRLLRLARLPKLLRPAVAGSLRLLGQARAAELLAAARACSADEYWRLTQAMTEYTRMFLAAIHQRGYDALIFPPHALPAMQHGLAIDLIPAASYSFLPNLLGIPAGVVAATRVRAGEESDRKPSRDYVERTARKVETGSMGLPVGVQVAARPWREDVVLSVMGALEEHFRQQADYPRPSDIPLS
jgi:fatty acid amide hydrolase